MSCYCRGHYIDAAQSDAHVLYRASNSATALGTVHASALEVLQLCADALSRPAPLVLVLSEALGKT